MTKFDNEIGELNVDELDGVSGGGWRQRPQPHFRNPEMQLEFDLQQQFTAMNTAISTFKMPSFF